jgi:hypothetical protein
MHYATKSTLTTVMMKIVITMVALLPMFVTFFVTFRTLELMIKFVPTLRTFMTFYLTFVMTLWTLVVMMDMALFTITIGFKTVHFITSPLFFSIYNMHTVQKHSCNLVITKTAYICKRSL